MHESFQVRIVIYQNILQFTNLFVQRANDKSKTMIYALNISLHANAYYFQKQIKFHLKTKPPIKGIILRK